MSYFAGNEGNAQKCLAEKEIVYKYPSFLYKFSFFFQGVGGTNKCEIPRAPLKIEQVNSKAI